MSAASAAPLLGRTIDELQELARSLGQGAFRGAQVFDWLYAKACPDFEGMTNLPAAFRQALAAAHATGFAAPERVDCSSDGTKKYLFPAGPGRYVEAAYIPEEDRATLCLSTQVGCKMGCLFCATGRMGFRSQLDPGQIVNQYLSLPERGRVGNLVYMGMGEPFDNTEAVLASLELFTHPKGMAFSPRRITVSSVGLLPGLKEFLARSECHLAISLHSPYDEERRGLMPVQHVYPVAEVVEELKRHDWSGQRRLSFEYILFAGVNDSLDHARELVRLVNGLRCRVNLINYHSVPGAALQGSPPNAVEAFQNLLKEKGLVATLRRSRGLDIQAACGLLSTKALSRAPERDY